LRVVADAVRGRSPQEATIFLKHLPHRGAKVILKVLKQAIANAVNNHNLNRDGLTFSSLQVNQGPTYKRSRAAARGRGHAIQKKTSHIKIILEAKDDQSTKSQARKTNKTNKNGSKS